MFSDKITLDRETLKVLAADTRVEILKRLSEHKETLTDIAEGMKLSPSTVKEHLDRLSQAGLIEQIEGNTKWKYYRLTGKGERLVKPYETNVLILLSASILFLAGSLLNLTVKLSQPTATAPRLLAEAAPASASIPHTDILFVVVFAVLTGVFAERLLKE